MSKTAARAAKTPANLPQRPGAWRLTVRRLSAIVEMEDGLPARPYLTLLVNLDREQILEIELSHEPPDQEALRSLLWRAMLKPHRELRQPPHRPQIIFCDQEALVETLHTFLTEIGVVAQFEAAAELLDQIVAMIEDEYGGESDHPGLLSIPGSSPELVGNLFTAAADAYRQEPWIYLSAEQPVKFAIPTLHKNGFIQLMGNSAIEYGLLLYWNWEDLERSYLNTGDPRPVLPQSGWISFSYATADLLSPDDLEAIDTHHWPVAGPEAYPLPIIMFEDHVERPDAATLEVFTLLLQALPDFAIHLEPDFEGDYLPFTHEVMTFSGEKPHTITLQYPAGQLRREAFPAILPLGEDVLDFEEEDDIFGVDVPESEFAGDGDSLDKIRIELHRPEPPPEIEVTQDMEDENVAYWQASPIARQNPQLVEAMRLVYEAWDELNPAQAIQLARRALEVSPDCAEAYVFLADVLAVNIGQALKFYQKGVQAGERSLGAAFFEEYRGAFWEHIEARPYLRARVGLSRTLWELGRRDEALQHCQELLRLDAADNMSARYAILLIYLEMGRQDEAYNFANSREDTSETWLYTTALLDFQHTGDTAEARDKLLQAIQVNPNTPDYLTGRKRMPVELPEIINPGHKSAAVEYASAFLPFWRQTPGAIDWLRKQAKSQSRPENRLKSRPGSKSKRK